MNHATPVLSILIPSVPNRLHKTVELFEFLSAQISAISPNPLVEILALTDNKFRTIGEKRQSLVETSIGTHIAFVDDDDKISENYVFQIVHALKSDPDVVTFEQLAFLKGHGSAIIDFDLRHQFDEPWQPSATVRRRPWHLCAWRRSIAIQCHFTSKNYGEDADWVNQANFLASTQIHIPKILHEYHWNQSTSEAPCPLD